MTPEDRDKWLQEEESRLIKYQYEHRGLSFVKLLLPPPTERKVNLVGSDNHIYRGSISRVPEDQFPPEVDEKSIDEEALYKEIRDMNFPPVPEKEPLGPSRRIGGSYTIVKRLALAPVQIENEMLEETTILGKDGNFYRGKARSGSTIEISKQLRGTKRSIIKTKQARSSEGYIEPTLVTLQIDKELPSQHKHKKSILKLPATNVRKITELIKSQNKQKMKEDINQRAGEDKNKDIPESTQVAETEESLTKDESDTITDATDSNQTSENEEPVKESETENLSSEEREVEQYEESDTSSEDTE